MRRAVHLLGLLVLAAGATGCAGDYVAKTRGVRQAYQSYDYDKALAGLDPKTAPPIDQLLVLLDRGMVLHAAGKYEESIQVLAQADRLSQQLDLVSVSEQAKVLVSNERESTYRGEDFEKLMITVLQALNYALLGKDEDALVEVRRVNERLRKMVADEKKPYEQLAIARYLGGVLYENESEEDSAFIDYYEAYKLQKSAKSEDSVGPLLRLAKRTERADIYKELKTQFPALDDSPVGRTEGQVVVIVEAGLAPVKDSLNKNYDGSAQGQLIAIPVFKDRWWGGPSTVEVAGKSKTAVPITSIAQVAKIHLDDRVGKLVAKQIAGMAVKAGLAAGLGAATKNEAVGALAFVLLNVNNVPDLRSWLSLPAEFQVARFRLAPGSQSVTVRAGGRTTSHPVEVKPGKVSLLVVRSY